MKILFVLPYERLSDDYYTEPLGIMYLSSVAKRAGHKCSATLANWPDLSDALAQFAPDIVAFSATTGAHNLFLRLARQIKSVRPNLFVLFGGPHPTYFPRMIEEQGVDAICRGEGEEAFEELLDCMQNDRDFTRVYNFWVKWGGRIYNNPVRPAILNLDSIPFPDRDLIEQFYKRPIRYLISARGCPFDCAYCFNHAFRQLYSTAPGERVRYRSVENVISELHLLIHNYPETPHFSFIDDTFNINKLWLRNFCESYRQEIRVPLSCICRVDLMTEDTANILANAGCVLIAVGIESGNDKIRQEVLKRNMSREAIIQGCQKIRDAGIKLQTYNILGIPPGHFEDDLETVELNVRCRPTIPEAFLLTPLPMTELGERTRAEGYWREDQDNSFFETFLWDQLTQRSRLLLRDQLEIETLQLLFSLPVKWPLLYKPVKWFCLFAGRNKIVGQAIQIIRKWGKKPAVFVFSWYMDWFVKTQRLKMDKQRVYTSFDKTSDTN